MPYTTYSTWLALMIFMGMSVLAGILGIVVAVINRKNFDETRTSPDTTIPKVSILFLVFAILGAAFFIGTTISVSLGNNNLNYIYYPALNIISSVFATIILVLAPYFMTVMLMCTSSLYKTQSKSLYNSGNFIALGWMIFFVPAVFNVINVWLSDYAPPNNVLTAFILQALGGGFFLAASLGHDIVFRRMRRYMRNQENNNVPRHQNPNIQYQNLKTPVGGPVYPAQQQYQTPGAAPPAQSPQYQQAAAPPVYQQNPYDKPPPSTYQ
jgi:hypothetical protein